MINLVLRAIKMQTIAQNHLCRHKSIDLTALLWPIILAPPEGGKLGSVVTREGKMTQILSSYALAGLLLTPLCLTVAACGARGGAGPASNQPASTSLASSVAAGKPNPNFAIAPAPTVAPAAVAVWDFESDAAAGTKQEFWGKALASFMIADLGASQNLRVIDREHLVEILGEQRLSISNLSDNTARLRVGKIIGAKYFIFGTYTIVGGEAALTARMVEVETGQIIEADSVGGNANDLRMLSMQLAVKFLRPLDQIVADREAHSTTAANGPPASAQRLFEQGLAYERRHEYQQAIDLYTRALTEYPHYSLAVEHLEEASEASARQ
jgi:TolB-like protein